VSSSCSGAPSPWIERWVPRAQHGDVALDVACGRGRHVRLLRERGFAVVGVDRDRDALDSVAAVRDPSIERVEADLENGPWPLGERSFALVVVTNYLWRPLFPRLLDAVAIGGCLVYETFLEGHERFGRPTNPEFLLRRGELSQIVHGAFDIVAFEEGPDGDPPVAMRQRICAQKRLVDAEPRWHAEPSDGRLRPTS